MENHRRLFEASEFVHSLLRVKSWSINSGEGWCIFGRNGSGKQLINQLLLGKLEPLRGLVNSAASHEVALISFESQQETYEKEVRLAANDFLLGDELGTRVADFLPFGRLDDPLIDDLNMRHRLQTFYRDLSSGESRKVLLLRALLTEVPLLVVDNPFDGLDRLAASSLGRIFALALERGTAVLLLVSNRSDIPDWITSFAHIEKGDLTILSGDSREAQLEQLDELIMADQRIQPGLPEDSIRLEDYPAPLITELKQCTVRYGDRIVFENLSFSIEPLQHTLVTGENGAGKSTLLGLITGDCLQCFNNNVTVFGHRRGSGESIWEIKRHFGLVSNELHRRYTVSCDVISAVCSGFYDSIGLYDSTSEFQERLGKDWLDALGISDLRHKPFQSLSYGEQRLVLIARAMVKSPLLLVLDEPTQGLDEINRQRILNFLECIEDRQHSTLLFVSHREDEYLPLFKQHFHLTTQI